MEETMGARFTLLVGIGGGLMYLAVVVCNGTETRLFRVVSTQATAIVRFDPEDGIVWSNAVSPAVCSVEWAPGPWGLWLTNHFGASVLCTGRVPHVDMPRAFIEGMSSTIHYQAPGEAAFPVSDSLGVDLGRDGSPDVLFWVERISSADEPSSTHYTALHVETRNAEVILRPYTNGEEIAETTTGGDTWRTIGQFGDSLVSSWMRYDWENGGGAGDSQGPWHGTRNACLPVRIRVEDRYHYGWVRLKPAFFRFNDETDFWFGDYSVEDCGLQAVPNRAISAGEAPFAE